MSNAFRPGKNSPMAVGCMFPPPALHAGGSASASSPPPPGMWLLDTGLLVPVPCLLQKSPLQLINYSRVQWDAGSWRCAARMGGAGEPCHCLAVPHSTLTPQSQSGQSWVPLQYPNSQQPGGLYLCTPQCPDTQYLVGHLRLPCRTEPP